MRVAVWLMVGVAAAMAAAACASTPAAPPADAAPSMAASTPAPQPTRDPARDSLPLVADIHLGASNHTWQGADDHVTLSVDNRGRDIQDLVVQSPDWVAEHGLAMGSTRACLPNLDAGQVECGPIYAGESMPVILRAMPAHVGTFHYEMRVFDQEAGSLVPIVGSDGRPVVFDFVEVVDPLTNQIPGGVFTPSPAPS